MTENIKNFALFKHNIGFDNKCSGILSFFEPKLKIKYNIIWYRFMNSKK